MVAKKKAPYLQQPDSVINYGNVAEVIPPGSIAELIDWLRSHAIDEVECLIPDMAGVARGKIIPCHKFIRGVRDDTLRIPNGIFMQTVTGDYIESDKLESGGDLQIIPDIRSIRQVPWYENPTAQVICDVRHINGAAVDFSPRYVLRKILQLYHQQGWQPIIAPEVEFYFVAINTDPDYPLKPPIGLSQRPQVNRQAYGIDAANEFDPIVDVIYDYAEILRLDIDTFTHEMGAGQVEINFNHGCPLQLADQVFLFKRAVRQAALKHKIYATFMAKPHQYQPGSSMHLHISVLDQKANNNIFSRNENNASDQFAYFVKGVQKHVMAAMAFYAPNVNSYRRITHLSDGPINSHWGADNRSVGLRTPIASAKDRRIENRIPGSDCNPYLAMAASLASGYLGLLHHEQGAKQIVGNAYLLQQNICQHIFQSLTELKADTALCELLGQEFINYYCEVKRKEFNDYHEVISSWERENLLLNV